MVNKPRFTPFKLFIKTKHKKNNVWNKNITLLKVRFENHATEIIIATIPCLLIVPNCWLLDDIIYRFTKKWMTLRYHENDKWILNFM